MRKAFTTSLILFATTIASAASAAPVTWTLQKPAARAQITNGPWVLAEGDAAVPSGNWPTPNPGTNNFQPYYQSYVAGNDQVMQGFFDYRPYKLEEAVVAAASSDFGRTWTFQQKVLDFAPSLEGGAATDVANGHPFVAQVGTRYFLYNLDRTAGSVGKDELIVHEITAPTVGAPLNGVPPNAQLGDAAVFDEGHRTKGLHRPDGIVAALPSTSPVTTFMYLEKQLVADFDAGEDAGAVMCADAAAQIDRTQLHLVDTTDGITFTNDRLVSGIIETNNGASVGPRGTIHKYADGHYGMFFSAGTLDECEDSDAFHYIGYAESTDLLTWTVVNGLKNPLLSTKDSDALPWYVGRTYAPNVLFSADGCSATMVFSGYAAISPKNPPKNDYRQIGVIKLTRACDAADAGDSGAVADSGGGPADASGGVEAGTSRVDAGSGNADTTGGDDGGCSYAPAAATGGAAWIALGGLGLMVARRRRRSR